MKKKYVEKPIQSAPSVYRVSVLNDDGSQSQTQQFRVRIRYKKGDDWTMLTKTFNSFDDAKKFARSNPTTPTITTSDDDLFEVAFEKFILHMRNVKKLRNSTIAFYQSRLEHFRFFYGLRVTTIKPPMIDKWLDLMYDEEYLETMQSTRMNFKKEYDNLSSFFNYYRNYVDYEFQVPLLSRHRERANARSKDTLETIRFMSEDEELRFRAMMATKKLVYEDLGKFQLNTGTRISEAAALSKKNVDLENRRIFIGQHISWARFSGLKDELLPATKTGHSRFIPMNDEVYEILKRRMETSTSEFIFEDPNTGGWLKYNVIQGNYDRVFNELGIDRGSTHVLRHTFAVRFLDQTKDIYALQLILGHTDLKQTQVYAKYTNEAVTRAFEKFKGVKKD